MAASLLEYRVGFAEHLKSSEAAYGRLSSEYRVGFAEHLKSSEAAYGRLNP